MSGSDLQMTPLLVVTREIFEDAVKESQNWVKEYGYVLNQFKKQERTRTSLALKYTSSMTGSSLPMLVKPF
jgi:hypothetical protein